MSALTPLSARLALAFTPTEARVQRMLAATRRDPEELLGQIPPAMGPATVRTVAIHALMAGCKPEYLPVLLGAVLGGERDDVVAKANAHGLTAANENGAGQIVVAGTLEQLDAFAAGS